MNYLALRAHNRADDSFHALEFRCLEATQRCIVGPQGAYLDPTAEDLYQSSLRYDRIARGWLVGGEFALAGAAALFVWELTRPKGRPGNIPFEPEVRSRRGGTGLGLRIDFEPATRRLAHPKQLDRSGIARHRTFPQPLIFPAL